MVRLFIFVNVLFYFSYCHLFLWDKAVIGIKPVEWYSVTLAIGAVILLMHYRRLIGIGSSAAQLLAWVACLMFYSGVSCVAIAGGDESSVEALISLWESLLLMGLLVGLFRAGNASRAGAWAVLVAVMVGVAINLVEFLANDSIALSSVPGRAAGLYGNANRSGNYLVLGMALSLWILPRRWRWSYCFLVALGVFVTFSRSALMMWALGVALVAWFRGFRLPRAFSIPFVASLLILAGATLSAGRWNAYLSAMGLDDRLDANTSARIGGSFLEQGDHSSLERALVARRGFERFLDAPVFGHGIGAAMSGSTGVSSHNQYIHIAVELGFIGLVLLISLIWVLWRTGTTPARLTAALFAFSCMFAHNNLEGPAIAVVMSLAVTLVAADSEDYLDVSGTRAG